MKELNLSPEETRKFKADCCDIIQSVILKFVESKPSRYNFIRLSSALVAKHVVENREKYSNRFNLLVDGLSASKKISFVADKVKFTITRYKHKHNFIPMFQNLIIKMIV